MNADYELREVTTEELQTIEGGSTLDPLSKMMSTLSNILKKISDTANGIAQNLK